MKNNQVVIRPFGGLGQIGSNMTLISDGKTQFFIDAGILFPYEDTFEIDYLIPDYKDVKDIQAIFITHGHEDHIGGIGAFSKQFPETPIYTSAFTKELITHKLQQQNLNPEVNIVPYAQTTQIGDFNIDFVGVNHSIPETYGIHISHQKYDFSLFYISDFKVDLNSKYERPFDFDKLEKLSKNKSKRVLLLDSTNILSKNTKTPSEMDIIPNLDKIFSELKGRIFVTTFSSNIHRIKTIVDLAKKYNRRVTALGRAVYSHLDSAKRAGLLDDSYSFEDPDTLKHGDKIVVFLSGCQGDFKGALRRYSYELDSTYKPKFGDTVIFSSKTIPGNEKKVSIILNKLSELKVNIVTADDALVHVSGHGGIEDIKMVINKYQPTDIIPIHGESFFLNRHYEFIQKEFPQAKAHLLYNHMDINLQKNGVISIDDPFQDKERPGPLLIHGKHIEIERTAISERRKLASQGIINIAINKKSKDFQINFYGLPNFHLSFQNEFTQLLKEEVKQIKDSRTDKHIEDIRVFTRRYYAEKLGYKPIVNISYV
jgi:ribonuclease J